MNAEFPSFSNAIIARIIYVSSKQSWELARVKKVRTLKDKVVLPKRLTGTVKLRIEFEFPSPVPVPVGMCLRKKKKEEEEE